MNILVEEAVSSYHFSVPGVHSGRRFVVGLSGVSTDKSIAALSMAYQDASAGRVEVSRMLITGDRAVLVDSNSDIPISFYLIVFDWIKLPLTLRIWQQEIVSSDALAGEDIRFLPIGSTVLSGPRTAIYTGEGEDTWTVGCRSDQEIENSLLRVNCGAGRSVVGVSSKPFTIPRWWEIDYGWYIHNFKEVRAVADEKIPEEARFSWSPLTELGILVDGNEISYQVKEAEDSSFQTLYQTKRKSSTSLRPAAVLGPQAFVYNCISTR